MVIEALLVVLYCCITFDIIYHYLTQNIWIYLDIFSMCLEIQRIHVGPPKDRVGPCLER